MFQLDTEEALGDDDPAEILPIARSLDAFVETYPESEYRQPALESRVRVWARLAELDPDPFCAAALRRAREWEASLDGSRFSFEARRVVSKLREESCGE